MPTREQLSDGCDLKHTFREPSAYKLKRYKLLYGPDVVAEALRLARSNDFSFEETLRIVLAQQRRMMRL